MVEMQYVQSSNVAAVGYDPELGELHIQFLNSPEIYVYQGVPCEVHERLMMSGSKGQFISREIKNVYPFYKT